MWNGKLDISIVENKIGNFFLSMGHHLELDKFGLNYNKYA